MSEKKWIKLKVGAFDGASMRKIKHDVARNLLTAVWFEILDFAGRCDASGALVDKDGVAYTAITDIAAQIDRDETETRMCIDYFLAERMIAETDGKLFLVNWRRYQTGNDAEDVKRKNRERQAKYRERKKASERNTENKLTEALPSEKNYGVWVSAAIRELKFSPLVQKATVAWIKGKQDRGDRYTERGLKSLLTAIKRNVETNGDEYAVNAITAATESGNARIEWPTIFADEGFVINDDK